MPNPTPNLGSIRIILEEHASLGGQADAFGGKVVQEGAPLERARLDDVSVAMNGKLLRGNIVPLRLSRKQSDRKAMQNGLRSAWEI